MRFGLKVLNGPHTGRVIEIPVSKFVIGREKGCQLRASGKMISRQHCVLIVRRSRLFVRDLFSRNGTFVNGDRTEADRQLRQDDCLQIGKLKLLVLIEDGLGAKKKPKVKDVHDAVARRMSDPVKSTGEGRGSDDASLLEVLGDDESEREEEESGFFSPGDTQVF